MKKNKIKYIVYLQISDRDDVDDQWNITHKVVFCARNKDEADEFIFTHRYMETDIDPNDDGSHWLHIQELYRLQKDVYEKYISKDKER